MIEDDPFGAHFLAFPLADYHDLGVYEHLHFKGFLMVVSSCGVSEAVV
jgi:hypothetical protein